MYAMQFVTRAADQLLDCCETHARLPRIEDAVACEGRGRPSLGALSGRRRDLGLRPRGPDLAGALLALLLGRPDLLPGLSLLERNRLCAVHEDVDRLAHRDVLPQRLVAALGLRALERLLDLVLFRSTRRARRGSPAERVEHLLVAHLDALDLDDRGQHALAPQRALGVGLRLGDQLLL